MNSTVPTKSLNSPHTHQEVNETTTCINSKADRGGIVTSASGASMAIDAGTVLAGSNGLFKITAPGLAHNTVYQTPTNGYDNQEIIIEILYSGDFYPDWASTYKFSNNTFPRPDPTQYTRVSGAVDRFHFKKSGSAWYCVGYFFDYQ